MKSLSLLGVFPLALTSLALPAVNQNQNRFNILSGLADGDKPQAIKDAFTHAWNGYQTYAYPMDELRPVSNKGTNPLYEIIFVPPLILDTDKSLFVDLYLSFLGTAGVLHRLMRFPLPLSWICQMLSMRSWTT